MKPNPNSSTLEPFLPPHRGYRVLGQQEHPHTPGAAPGTLTPARPGAAAASRRGRQLPRPSPLQAARGVCGQGTLKGSGHEGKGIPVPARHATATAPRRTSAAPRRARYPALPQPSARAGVSENPHPKPPRTSTQSGSICVAPTLTPMPARKVKAIFPPTASTSAFSNSDLGPGRGGSGLGVYKIRVYGHILTWGRAEGGGRKAGVWSEWKAGCQNRFWGGACPPDF